MLYNLTFMSLIIKSFNYFADVSIPLFTSPCVHCASDMVSCIPADERNAIIVTTNGKYYMMSFPYFTNE